MKVIYEDNHIIAVNKEVGEIVQGDKTGDKPLAEIVKDYIKVSRAKPGNVFLGVAHRLDRPVSGVVIFALTSKALTRMNDMFRRGEVSKTYWALTRACSREDEGTLTHWLTRNEQQNKSYAHDSEVPGAKKAVLKYRVIDRTDNYFLIEVSLLTGRHHQIRCQLSHIGCPIKGDLKYGAKRSNADGGISLIAREVRFVHPVSGKDIHLVAPLPEDNLWQAFNKTYPIRS